MQILLNRTYDRLGLSTAAYRELIARSSTLLGHTFVLEYFDEASLEDCEPRLSEELDHGTIALVGDQVYFLCAAHAQRLATDSQLLSVVQLLGAAANPPKGHLEILELPDGAAFKILVQQGSQRVQQLSCA